MKYFIDAMNKYDALMLIVILLAIFGLLSIIYINYIYNYKYIIHLRRKLI